MKRLLVLCLLIIPLLFSGQPVPILATLNTEIKSAVVYDGSGHLFSHMRNLTTTEDLEALHAIIGIPGTWDGYNSPTPFDGFTYPLGGHWISIVSVQAITGHWFNIWAWQQTSKPETLLVFVFLDNSYNCDTQGLHCGNHNFQFYYVDYVDWFTAIKE